VWPLTTSSAGSNRRNSALANADDNGRAQNNAGRRQLQNRGGTLNSRLAHYMANRSTLLGN
jgi:hypothetical protein